MARTDVENHIRRYLSFPTGAPDSGSLARSDREEVRPSTGRFDDGKSRRSARGGRPRCRGRLRPLRVSLSAVVPWPSSCNDAHPARRGPRTPRRGVERQPSARSPRKSTWAAVTSKRPTSSRRAPDAGEHRPTLTRGPQDAPRPHRRAHRNHRRQSETPQRHRPGRRTRGRSPRASDPGPRSTGNGLPRPRAAAGSKRH